MNITLINAQEKLIRTAVSGRYIVEYYTDPGNDDLLNIKIYDPETNTCCDVVPSLKKLKRTEVINCIWNSQYLYFAASSLTPDKKLQTGIYRYNPVSRRCQQIYTFVRDPFLISGRNRIRIFMLSETAALIQGETCHSEISGSMIGNIEFDLTFLRMDINEETPVADTNFINNGINKITAVSDNKIMVKTGYSWIEDDRMEDSQSSGAYIESVYVTTTSKFIADLTIASDIIDMPLIDSAYKDRHITRPHVTGAYIHYTLAGQDQNESRCVFYNCETGERLEYNAGSLEPDDLDITYVIKNQPYIRQTLEHEINFLNIKKAEMDISFYDENFKAQSGSVFVLQSRKKQPKMHVYTYPGLKRVLCEPVSCLDLCSVGENCYIYC